MFWTIDVLKIDVLGARRFWRTLPKLFTV